ncbi:MAG: protein DpdD [Planctomycetaceae bacterium]
MTRTIADPQNFLKNFFGNDNAIQWEQYESGVPTDPVRSSLERWVLRFQKQQSPFLLPRVEIGSKRTAWYVLCTDPREARSMRETLLAFVGPSYADFNGELARLAENDAIDQLCRKHFGSLVFRLSVADNQHRAKVNELLGRLIECRDCESSRSLAVIKPIGRLLRDLEMAILAGNQESAWQVYAEIRSRGRLSATNLAFLQVHIFGFFAQWTEILSMPILGDLLQVRRPKRISEQIATAVYRQFILKHENSNDAKAAIDTYRNVGMRYRSLIRSTEGIRSDDAIKFAVVAAIASDPAKQQVAHRLIENSVADADHAWCDALLATLSESAVRVVVTDPTTTYDDAETRFNEGNFDEAFALYLDHTPSYRSVCRVLEAAVEVDTHVAAGKAIDYLNSAPDEVCGKVLGRRVCTGQIEILSGILGQDTTGDAMPIASIEDWFQCVDQDQDLSDVNQVLEYGIPDWADESKFEPSRVVELLKLSRTGKAAEVIRNAVPIFIRSFLVDQPASRVNKPIYNALIDLLIYDDTIGTDDLAAVEQLIEAVLTTAPSVEANNNDFTFATEITSYLWKTMSAPRHLDWVLSMLDLLIDVGTQQHADLTPILAAIADSSRAWTRRVSGAQWSLLELLATDLNLIELVRGLRPELEADAEVAETDIHGLLKGQSIAVYSLTERIARRFGQLAEQTFDDIKIHYIHDKSLTDRMKSLARSADIFIVNTWDAKHAATNGIKDNRQSTQVTLEPSSKSAIRMVETLIDYVRAVRGT